MLSLIHISLQGAVAGMNFSTPSSGGTLNSTKSFNIRGTGTIGAGSSCLLYTSITKIFYFAKLLVLSNTTIKIALIFLKQKHLLYFTTGQVRVLLGSTAKMGAGTNVQDRLVALHDLDCPWSCLLYTSRCV